MTDGGPSSRALEAGSVQAETELLKRDRILDAIAKIAAGLMAAASLDDALPAALQQVGEAIGADRIVVLEATRAPAGGFLVHERGAWNAPGVAPRIRAGDAAGGPGAAAILGNFFATLAPGQIFTAFPRTMHGPLAEFFSSLSIQSLLLVPILIEGQPWGYLVFDDCHAEREWTTAASDTLQVLAEIFPAAPDPGAECDYAEPAPPRAGAAYVREHEAIFAPMRRLFALVREIATAITHEVGAFG